MSEYYPPRARWYSPLFYVWQSLRRRAWLDRIHLPDGIGIVAFVGGVFIPGVAFYMRKERMVGRAVFSVYVALAAVFIIWIGHPIANGAFGLMLSVHVSSILFLLNPWLVHARFVYRILCGVALLVVVGFGFYGPLRNHIQAKYLLPLTVNDKVVVVQTFSTSQSVQREDWIAYRLEAAGVGVVRVRTGLGLRPVLAVAGDRVRFRVDAFLVNGVSRPRLPHMPVSGDMVVPEKHWFLWPEVAINGYGNTPGSAIDATMLQLAIVSETQFVGKPFLRWFWRQQTLQ